MSPASASSASASPVPSTSSRAPTDRLPGTSPPALRGWPLVGNALSFFRDPVGVLRRGYETHGPVFSLSLGGKKAAVLVGPEHQAFFFTKTDDVLTMQEVYDFIIPMFGQVTMAAPPAEYREQRAILRPAFDPDRMAGYVDAMVRETTTWLDGLGDAGAFDVWAAFEQLSMHIAARALMGDAFRERMGDRFWALYRDVAGGMEFILPQRLPLPKFRRRDRARAALRDLLRPLIAERRARPDAYTDLLQVIAASTYSDGRLVPDDVVMGLVLILIFAAYETTAAQTCWALIQLLHHPAALQSVLDEQSAVWGRRDVVPAVDGGSLHALKRLGWCLRETERMHPITTMLWRHTARDYEADGYTVPAGWVTMVCPPVAHRLPEVFPEPDVFDPERFDPERQRAPRHPFALINYGGGFHKCMGVHFAANEMKVILSLLLRRYTLSLPDADPQPDYSTGVTRPKAPYRIRYRRRASPLG